MDRLLTIGEAAKALGVSISTLRRWEDEGRLVPEERTAGGQRRYRLSKLRPELCRAISDKDIGQTVADIIEALSAMSAVLREGNPGKSKRLLDAIKAIAKEDK